MSAMVAEKPLLQGQKQNGSLPTYTVVIHKNEDGVGYWAECELGESCAFTDGDTIHETQCNMYESVSLMLEDDYPKVKDFSLAFVLSHE